MRKTIGRLLLVILCVVVLVSCAKETKPSLESEMVTEDQTVENETSENLITESQTTENIVSEGQSDDVPITESEKTEETTNESLTPGIKGPEGWPEDVPTPMTGEFLWSDWAPDQSFYTVDIRYMQAEIDAYAERLQDAEFSKKDTEKYKKVYGDAGVYANDKWEIVLGDEGVNGDYTYISIYPIK
ncbi:MAG: hypothetical protein GX314_02515 [Clostridiaceae bacterium]|jgi:hypothetical protein|nr:hypothetical protein [Clostridiaceae bacterium]